MTDDQIKRLQALSVEVAEVVLLDADPRNWSAYGEKPKDMSKEERGNAKWDRGIALSSLGVLVKLLAVSGGQEGADSNAAPPGMSEGEAETAAVALLDRVQGRMSSGKSGR